MIKKIFKMCTFDNGPSQQLGWLPDFEQEHLTSCVHGIEHLLRDEHVSLTRHVIPVTSSTLQQVAEHVRQAVVEPVHDVEKEGDVSDVSSELSSVCMQRSVPLLLVFGPDQSLAQFVMVSSRTLTCTCTSCTCILENICYVFNFLAF